MIDFELIKLELNTNLEEIINKYKSNISRIQAGRANPAMLDIVKVNYYETLTPLNQLSSITMPEPRQLIIKPFDKGITKEIIVGIDKAKLNLTISDEGDQVRLTFPELTTNRRKELVKQFSQYNEQTKIQIRQERQHANKKIKNEEEISDDQKKDYLSDVQGIIDNNIELIEKLSTKKEKDLMSI